MELRKQEKRIIKISKFYKDLVINIEKIAKISRTNYTNLYIATKGQ